MAENRDRSEPSDEGLRRTRGSWARMRWWLVVALLVLGVGGRLLLNLSNRNEQSDELRRYLRTVAASRYYKLALSRYHERLGRLIAERDRLDAERNADAIVHLAEWKAKLAKNEGAILDRLRGQSRDRKLDFDGECAENEAFLSKSDASARIFGALVDEDRVERRALADMFRLQHNGASPAWTPVLRKLAEDRRREGWKPALIALYRSGETQRDHRDTLERLSAQGDTEALTALLYSEDPRTRRLRPIRGDANTSVACMLLPQTSLPEIRVLAGKYLIEIGRPQGVEDVFTEVLWQPFAGRSDELCSQDDVALSHAKENATRALFYQAKTDRAFLNAYAFGALSDFREAAPRVWQREISSAHSSLCIQECGSVLYEVTEHW